VDFKNTLVVMTSNIGSEYIAAAGRESGNGKSDDAPEAVLDYEMELRVKDELKKHFRPEFLNRVDEVILFHRLTRENLRGIAERQVALLRRRLAEREMALRLTRAAEDQLARDGYDPVYGARPLKRLIQQQVENPLARRILAGEFGPGDTVVVDSDGEVYTFEKEVAARVG